MPSEPAPLAPDRESFPFGTKPTVRDGLHTIAGRWCYRASVERGVTSRALRRVATMTTYLKHQKRTAFLFGLATSAGTYAVAKAR